METIEATQSGITLKTENKEFFVGSDHYDLLLRSIATSLELKRDNSFNVILMEE